MRSTTSMFLATLVMFSGCTQTVATGEPPADDDNNDATTDDDSADDDSAIGDDDSADDDDSAVEPAIDADLDGYSTVLDCDDEDAAINPGADEICDGIDQDCDGLGDNGLETGEYWLDQDGDGFGAGESEQNCGLQGFAPESGDCNDTDDSIHPGAEDVPGDGIDSDCDDESQPAGDDDSAAGDDDDATTPTPNPDQDGDGFSGAPDCNDADATINPGATDTCGDGIDSDCDGLVSDEVPFAGFIDLDGDGFGYTPFAGCAVPTNGVSVGGDCNDADATIYPGASEATEGLDSMDNDCDGQIDEVFQAYVELGYSTDAQRTLTVQLYSNVSQLGAWWDTSIASAGATLEVLFMSSTVPAVCGLRFNVIEPDSNWYCEGSGSTATLNQAPYVGIWFAGVWYDETDLVTWTSTSGGCSALLIVSSAASCQP